MATRRNYRDDYEDYRTRRANVAGTLGWGLVGLVCLIVLSAIGYLAWGDLRARIAAEMQPTSAPIIIVATPQPIRPPAPARIQAPAVIVQQVPAGQAPQPIILPPPAPIVQAVDAPAIEPPPPPIVIIHNVSSDGAHQVITGSGACKVARVAARCSK